jgi:hypothetical protein
MIGAVTERNIHNVRIALAHADPVAIPWASRDALLERFQGLESLDAVRDAFVAVGTTRPIVLTDAQKAELLGIIDGWSSGIDDRLEAPPDGISELRAALHDDLRGSRSRASRVEWRVRSRRLSSRAEPSNEGVTGNSNSEKEGLRRTGSTPAMPGPLVCTCGSVHGRGGLLANAYLTLYRAYARTRSWYPPPARQSRCGPVAPEDGESWGPGLAFRKG